MARQLAAALDLWPLVQEFISADTWAESQRIVEQHPELLSDRTDTLLGQLADAAHTQGDENAVRILAEHRALLRRCREAGTSRAFAEKMLPPDVLKQAAAQGLTPEQALEIARRPVGSPLPPGGRGARGEGLPIPPEFADDLCAAQEGLACYEQTGALEALNAAVAAWERILNHPDFSRADHRFRLATMNDAGGVFLQRYLLVGLVEDLNRASHCLQEAIALSPPDSADRSIMLANLVIALGACYMRTGQVEYLEEALKICQRALDTTSLDSPHRPLILNNLGHLLFLRYHRTGRLEDLEEAVHVCQNALNASSLESPHRPLILNNIGRGHLLRYNQIGRLEDLEEAVNVCQQALDATSPDSPLRPSVLTNLGEALQALHNCTGHPEYLYEAIRLYQQAVDSTSPNSADFPPRLARLGNGLHNRYTHSGRHEDLGEC